MGQEFIIKSQALEDKINQLLPSQGGFQAGVDLSASTTVIPIIDLTESAEGSALRQDLQRSFSHGNTTAFAVSDVATTTIINTTGYFNIQGNVIVNAISANPVVQFFLSDGASTKTLNQYFANNLTAGTFQIVPFDYNIFLGAGESFIINSTASGRTVGSFRQIASLNGTLSDPT
jgi:hypothetical protein